MLVQVAIIERLGGKWLEGYALVAFDLASIYIMCIYMRNILRAISRRYTIKVSCNRIYTQFKTVSFFFYCYTRTFPIEIHALQSKKNLIWLTKKISRKRLMSKNFVKLDAIKFTIFITNYIVIKISRMHILLILTHA